MYCSIQCHPRLGSLSSLIINLIWSNVCAKLTSVIHIRTAVVKQSADVQVSLVSNYPLIPGS